jgi:hypothetical protein
MTYGYEEALARRAAATQPLFAGGSGYFAKRGTTLDPSLFEESDHLRPDVRRFIADHFYSWCRMARLHDMEECTQLWIAGSGITTAWNADRESGGEPGDLDVMVGLDYLRFTTSNPYWRGSPDAAIAHELNNLMHQHLWPHTAKSVIHGNTYELTYYVNPGVGAGPNDLLAINPYAAYNVTNDVWTLHPVQVPEGFSADYFSSSDRAQVEDDLTGAREVLAQFQWARDRVQRHPREVAALRTLHEVVRDGAKLFDSIHDGRKTAFAPGGKGYFDAANFRWQAGKGNGAISVLRALKQLDEQAHKDTGMPCTNVQHLLLVSALANGGKYR